VIYADFRAESFGLGVARVVDEGLGPHRHHQIALPLLGMPTSFANPLTWQEVPATCGR
jgi:hypothetical protein